MSNVRKTKTTTVKNDLLKAETAKPATVKAAPAKSVPPAALKTAPAQLTAVRPAPAPVAAPKPAPAPVQAAPAQVAPAPTPIKPALKISEAPKGGHVFLELVKPEAKKVFVAGSFNEWKPETTPLVLKGNGRWVGDLT